jgi:hypothetical protein
MTETGFVYKLCCLDSEIKDIYVGSTKANRARKCSHKSACLNANDINHNYNVYKFIRENGGWGNWDMVIIEEYKYNTKHELHSRERYWLETLNATLNRAIPTQTITEWRETNKERLTEDKKVYYQEHKDKLIQKSRDWYSVNKEQFLEKSKTYRSINKDKIAETKKIYAEKNRDSIKIKKQKQYELNKEHISKKAKERYKKNSEAVKEKSKLDYEKNKEKLLEQIECECGSYITRDGLMRHRKTKKHQFYETTYNYIYS